MPDAYEIFLENLRKKKGLDLTGYKRPQMERRITSLMRSMKITEYETYLDLMSREIAHWRKFLDTITINVSEFYRNPTQWDVLGQKILPELISNSSGLRLWSAGCSTGEEPYTLAMVMMSKFPNVPFTLMATDVDDEVMHKAKNGVYSDKAVASLPPNYVSKYFSVQGNQYSVSNEVKSKVKFAKHNLLTDSFDRNFDLILCRNVVIYFTEESKAVLYRNFYSSLKPGGILFTGSTEQIFHSREIGFSLVSSFFYQRNA